jgi:thymidine kinase
MSRLYYKFGAMGSSKTANALMTRFNYLEKGHEVWLIKPATDTRDDEKDENGNTITIIKSRIGLSAQADVIGPDDFIIDIMRQKNKKIDAIVCDECQFLTEEQVDQLKYIAEYDDIPVLCFGLRSDFRTKLFPGSKRLFEVADSITEIKSICKCGKKAVVNARFDSNGQVVTDGDQIDIGGNEKYEGMCWKCWQTLIAEKEND